MSEQASPESAPEPAPAPAQRPGFYTRGSAVVATIVWIFIGLGTFSDASLLINDLRIELMSIFTNTYEYETIGKIHVGNTVSFVEEMVGEPQVSRGLGDGVSANYFFSDKYLLTLFYKDERVGAYTVLPLRDDFAPDISGLSDSIGAIGEFTYSQLPAPPEHFLLDDSRTASYYIESVDTERSGRFLDLYMANLFYGVGGTGPKISALYKKSVYGTDEEIDALLKDLRGSVHPNMFGRGELPLAKIEKSLLTTAEFKDYFDPK